MLGWDCFATCYSINKLVKEIEYEQVRETISEPPSTFVYIKFSENVPQFATFPVFFVESLVTAESAQEMS